MQPRQQNLFVIIPFLLFSLANCVEQDYVKSIKFYNRLNVQAAVTATYHVDPLPTGVANVGDDIVYNIAGGGHYTFLPQTLGSGWKPIRKITTSVAGGHVETCDVQKEFAVGVVEQLELELIQPPEDFSPDLAYSVDGGLVKGVRVHSWSGHSIKVTATYSWYPLELTPTADTYVVKDHEIGDGGMVNFIHEIKNTHMPIRKMKFIANSKSVEYNIDKRFGHEKLFYKRIQLRWDANLDVPHMQFPTDLADSWIQVVRVINHLTENADVFAWEDNKAKPGVTVAPGGYTDIDISGQHRSKWLKIIKVVAGGKRAEITLDSLYDQDQVDRKDLVIVYPGQNIQD